MKGHRLQVTSKFENLLFKALILNIYMYFIRSIFQGKLQVKSSNFAKTPYMLNK